MSTLAVTRDFNLQTNWDRGGKKKKTLKGTVCRLIFYQQNEAIAWNG